MKFGVRQCANIVFRAKQETTIGTTTFHEGQPVLYIDTATTSNLEQASSTVYAQGGRGNARLIAWEGDKTLTFTVTDALISPVSLSMLSGAGLVKETGERVHVHATTAATMKIITEEGQDDQPDTYTGVIDLTDALIDFGEISKNNGVDGGVTVDAGKDAPLFIMETQDDGSLTGNIITSIGDIQYSIQQNKALLSIPAPKIGNVAITQSMNILLDYYVVKNAEKVSEIQITPQDFAGYYYVEADTLFRSQEKGIDMPANLTFPNVKIQSNFSITMAGSGDPSTFDFIMDAFPGYTYFNKTKKVMCVIQIVEDSLAASAVTKSVMLEDNTVQHSEPMIGDSDLFEPLI